MEVDKDVIIYVINFDGLGDAWYSIPVLRYLSKITEKKVYVYSCCKTLNPILKRFDFINLIENVPYGYEIVKLFNMDKNYKEGITLLNHDTTDFITKPLFNGMVLSKEDKELLFPKIKTKDFKKYDLVFHIAETWKSRSISKEVWKKLYKKYSEEGYSIAVIGKEVQACDMIKKCICIDVNEEDNYVNKLSLDETINLIDNSRVLVTGQGGISVLAGGLRNCSIVVVEGCVHKEYRYIIRNGSYDWNVKYVPNRSKIYHTGVITNEVTDDIRQMPIYEDMVEFIDYFLN